VYNFSDHTATDLFDNLIFPINTLGINNANSLITRFLYQQNYTGMYNVSNQIRLTCLGDSKFASISNVGVNCGLIMYVPIRPV